MLNFLKGNKPPKKTTEETAKQPAEAPQKKGLFSRLKQGLKKTRSALTTDLDTLLMGKKTIDDELLENLETHLLTADVGSDATDALLKEVTRTLGKQALKNPEILLQTLKTAMAHLLQPCEIPLNTQTHTPFVILMAGINGAGKTTTIGKLAKQLQAEGKSVILAAGDTFRAAAIEQLQTWGERNNIPVIAQHAGADSASVIFDACQAAKARKIDVVIADTAGRLHTQGHLMEELKKIKRVITKVDATAPHEVLLVLDSGIGQNALIQAEQFHEAVGVSGLCVTKLDGTAKGGIIFAIANKLALPIRFIGIGESIDDLRPFEAKSFVEALFDHASQED